MGQRARRDSLLSAIVRATERQGRAIEKEDYERAFGYRSGVLYRNGLPRPSAVERDRYGHLRREWSFS